VTRIFNQLVKFARVDMNDIPDLCAHSLIFAGPHARLNIWTH
jgi:hypothetical protein